MNGLISVAVVVCVVSIGCSILTILIPNGNMKKICSLAVGAFLICSMLVPIKNFTFDFNAGALADKSELSDEKSGKAYRQAIIDQTEENLEVSLSAYLAQNGYLTDKCKISLAVNEQGGIYIKHISIYILTESKASEQRLKSLVKDKFEIYPEIIERKL